MPNVVTGGTFVFDNAPVGCVFDYLKNLSGCPSLPSGWVECNGQTISDGESPFDGVAIPNLNGDNRFLRGNSTSGGVGGEETHTLTSGEVPAHTHQVTYRDAVYSGSYHLDCDVNGAGEDGSVTTSSFGGSGAHENKPPYYNTVKVMRIK